MSVVGGAGMRGFVLSLLAGALMVGPGASTSAAQSESGGASLEGAVRAADGKAVPNASVKILSLETGYARTVVTRADGRFFAPMLPVGRYSVEATATGFGAGKRNDVLLRVGATQTVDFALKPSEA